MWIKKDRCTLKNRLKTEINIKIGFTNTEGHMICILSFICYQSARLVEEILGLIEFASLQLINVLISPLLDLTWNQVLDHGISKSLFSQSSDYTVRKRTMWWKWMDVCSLVVYSFVFDRVFYIILRMYWSERTHYIILKKFKAMEVRMLTSPYVLNTQNCFKTHSLFWKERLTYCC